MSDTEVLKEKKKSKKRKHPDPEIEPGSTDEVTTKEKKSKRKHKPMEIVESEQFTYQQGAKVGDDDDDDDDDDLSGLKRNVSVSKKKEKKKKKGEQQEQQPGQIEEIKENIPAADDEIDMSALNTKKKKANPIAATTEKKESSTPLAPSASTRVFLGNLSFQITDDIIHEYFGTCGTIQGVHWVTDKTTGKFYGSAFIDFETNEAAVAAVKLNGTEILNRPVKVGFATGANKTSEIRHNHKQKMGAHIAQAPLMQKPAGCTTVFLGNLPFTINEESLTAAFQHCGEISQIRWVEKDGEFKGCGFIEFATTEATDEAVKLNGSDLLGRPIRVDYSKNKER